MGFPEALVLLRFISIHSAAAASCCEGPSAPLWVEGELWTESVNAEPDRDSAYKPSGHKKAPAGRIELLAGVTC